MADDDQTRIIYWKTPEGAEFFDHVKRAMAITARLNRLTYEDMNEVRSLFVELTGQRVGDSFRLIPPFYTENGTHIRIGRRVFINQCCTFYDYGGIDIADDVMIGPNVSLLTTGHPIAPSRRRDYGIAKPIVLETNVWIAANVTIIGGVRVGENAVVAAGSVVSKDVPPNTFVAGAPARIVRSIGGE